MFDRFGFKPASIEKVVKENRLVKSFYLRVDLPPPQPGQFYMVWLPEAEEIPISASGYQNGILRLSISKVGETSAKMHLLQRGEKLFLRGPFGRGFKLEGHSFLLVGGGYGMAPLIFAAHVLRGRKLKFLVGAKTKEELLFVKEAGELGEVCISTEDGSEGEKGLVTDLLEKEKGKFDWILTCGPEPMMAKVLELCQERGWEAQFCLERYMKCGFGLCGSCVLDPGLRVCVDGPVFERRELEKTEFGRTRRDASGRRESIH
jgi:dihydroorotate dehydrogenase electron transfer subunit